MAKTHTNLLDVFEGDFLALSGRHVEDVHLQRSQSQRSIILQLRAEPLKDHVVTTLQQSRKLQSYIRIQKSVLGLVICVSSLHRAIQVAVHPCWVEISCSQPLCLEIPSKGYSLQSLMKDSEAQNGELWQEKMIIFPSLRQFHLTNYQKNPMGKQFIILDRGVVYGRVVYLKALFANTDFVLKGSILYQSVIL